MQASFFSQDSSFVVYHIVDDVPIPLNSVLLCVQAQSHITKVELNGMVTSDKFYPYWCSKGIKKEETSVHENGTFGHNSPHYCDYFYKLQTIFFFIESFHVPISKGNKKWLICVLVKRIMNACKETVSL